MIGRTALGLALLTIAGALAAPALASPNLLGATGLIRIPTADVLPPGGYNLGGFVSESNPFDITDSAQTTLYTGNYGVQGGLELGVVGLSNTTDIFTGNAKLMIEPEVGNRVGIAAGVLDFLDKEAITPYIVFSKTLVPGHGLPFGADEVSVVRIHVGGSSEGVLHGLFAGASVVIGKSLMAMSEWDGDDFNFGGRLFVGDNLRIHGFYLGGPKDFAGGVSWNARF